MDTIKLIGKYLNVPVGTVCYNTDKVLTTSFGKENVEGFASIILRLSSKSNHVMKQDEILISYQWLEHISMYANQAFSNPAFAKSFLQGINGTLEKSSYLSGNHLNITDVAMFYTIYPIIERLSLIEQESLIHVCRWFKNVQAQPGVCANKKLLPLNTLILSVLSPAVH